MRIPCDLCECVTASGYTRHGLGNVRLPWGVSDQFEVPPIPHKSYTCVECVPIVQAFTDVLTASLMVYFNMVLEDK